MGFIFHFVGYDWLQWRKRTKESTCESMSKHLQLLKSPNMLLLSHFQVFDPHRVWFIGVTRYLGDHIWEEWSGNLSDIIIGLLSRICLITGPQRQSKSGQDLEHCSCTLSLGHLGSEMIIAEIQTSIQRSFGGHLTRPHLVRFPKLGTPTHLLLPVGETN